MKQCYLYSSLMHSVIAVLITCRKSAAAHAYKFTCFSQDLHCAAAKLLWPVFKVNGMDACTICVFKGRSYNGR